MITVLDPKRSNAINIGLTTLPPVHVIKAALLNFDEFAVSKDGIEVGIPVKGWAGSGPSFGQGAFILFLPNIPSILGLPWEEVDTNARYPDQH